MCKGHIEKYFSSEVKKAHIYHCNEMTILLQKQEICISQNYYCIHMSQIAKRKQRVTSGFSSSGCEWCVTRQIPTQLHIGTYSQMKIACDNCNNSQKLHLNKQVQLNGLKLKGSVYQLVKQGKMHCTCKLCEKTIWFELHNASEIWKKLHNSRKSKRKISFKTN